MFSPKEEEHENEPSHPTETKGGVKVANPSKNVSTINKPTPTAAICGTSQQSLNDVAGKEIKLDDCPSMPAIGESNSSYNWSSLSLSNTNSFPTGPLSFSYSNSLFNSQSQLVSIDQLGTEDSLSDKQCQTEGGVTLPAFFVNNVTSSTVLSPSDTAEALPLPLTFSASRENFSFLRPQLKSSDSLYSIAENYDNEIKKEEINNSEGNNANMSVQSGAEAISYLHQSGERYIDLTAIRKGPVNPLS